MVKGKGQSKSTETTERIVKSSLVRVALPFSYSRHYDERVESLLGARPRPAALAEVLASDLGIEGEAAAACFASGQPIFHALLKRLREPPVAEGQRAARWRPERGGLRRELNSVLLPQQVELLLGRDDDDGVGDDIAMFALDEGQLRGRFGELVFASTSQHHDAALSGRRPLLPKSGAFCIVQALRLVLCSAGVGIILLDLHPVLSTEAPEKEDAWERWLGEVTGFVASTQYVPGGQRDSKTTLFLAPDPVLLASVERDLMGAKGAIIADVGARLADRVAKGALSLLGEAHPEVGKIEVLPGKLVGAIRARTNMICKAFFDATGDSAVPADDPARAAIAAHVQRPAGTQGRGRELLVLRMEACHQSLGIWPWERQGSGAGKESVELAIGQACAQAFDAQVESFLDVLAGAMPLSAPPSDPAIEGSRTWNYDDVIQLVFGDLGLPMAIEDHGRLLLSGDRMFTFTHIRLPKDTFGDDERQRALAMRLSRRHDLGHDSSPTDGRVDAPGMFEPFDTLRYAVSLEGVCAVQREGSNSQFFQQVQVVRERHFSLVLLALVYRFALLNLTLEGTRVRSRAEDTELAHIERLRARVEHFTHWVFHGHVSNITHLQGLFDLLLERMNVHRLWGDVERDIPQYLERRKTIIEKREQQRREVVEARKERFEKMISILGAVFVVASLIELGEKFGLDVSGFFSGLALPVRLAVLGGLTVGAAVLALVVNRFLDREPSSEESTE